MESSTTRYDYTGDVQTVTLTPGRYKFEAFGAGGGNDVGRPGSRGGYACGEILLTSNKTFFLCIGGAGLEGTAIRGGYNGGGKSGGAGSSGSGGGATHIATGALNRGTLASYEAAKNEVLLVAGGGGGAGYYNSPTGSGGGANGGPNNAGEIATQTTGYSFGQGEDRVAIAEGDLAQINQITGNASYISRHNGSNYYTTVATITITANGILKFGSTSSTADVRRSDPYGYIYKNGYLLASDDDGGNGYNFYMEVSVVAGDVITLKIAGYSSSGSTPWYCDYPSSPPVDGGGGGGGWYGGFCSSADSQGGGGSGYANTSVLSKTVLTTGGGSANATNGYILITKIVYRVNLAFENCTGTSNYLVSDKREESIVTYKGEKIITNSALYYFVEWILPEKNNDIVCTSISKGQYRITLKCDTNMLQQDVSYTIRALYRQGRINSNLYKRAQEQYLCEFENIL